MLAVELGATADTLAGLRGLVATCDFGLRAFAMLLVLSRLGQRSEKDCSEMRER